MGLLWKGKPPFYNQRNRVHVICLSPGMKEAMVVKIAYQCSDMYADAMKLMQLPSLKEMWPRVSLNENSAPDKNG